METIEIQIEPRDAGTKGAVKRLRREGKVPGVFYGPKTPPVLLAVDRKQFSTRVAELEGSHLIRIKSDSPLLAEKVALVKETQLHPVTGEVMHADLYEVDLANRIRVNVPLHFMGKAVGVVRGGILQPIVREVEVECLPMDIPEYLNVEVSELDIGDSLHVTNLAMPEGVVAISEAGLTLVTVVPPSIEEAPTVEAPVAVVEGAEAAPAVAGDEKKKDEGAAS